MSHGFSDPASAIHRAIIAVSDTIRAQATIMGYPIASHCSASCWSAPLYWFRC
jgi:hypothetical protein